MSKTDADRWLDWRTNRKHPLRVALRCKCGRRFLPDVERQIACRACCELLAASERAPTTADEIERDNIDQLLKKALAEHEQYKPIDLAQPRSDQERLWRKSDSRPSMPQQNSTKLKKTSRSAGMNKRVAKVALKHLRSGKSIRQVSKMLGINEQVVRDHAIMTVEDARFRAACDGKINRQNRPEHVQESPGQTKWIASKTESRCQKCQSTIFVGEHISRPDKRWIHTTCAVNAGYIILNGDGSLNSEYAA